MTERTKEIQQAFQRYSDGAEPDRSEIDLISDDDLEFDEKSGHYKFGEINWQEFYDVLAGNGPCNQQRMRVRRAAEDNGAWVREAAAAYAQKQASREAA